MLNRNDNHLVRGPLRDIIRVLDCEVIIYCEPASKRQRPLVDLVVLLTHHSLHESQAVPNVAVEGHLFLVVLRLQSPEFAD